MPQPQPIVIERSPVVNALADAWVTIRHHHPELPDVFIAVVAGSDTKQHRRRRHLAALGWQGDDPRLSVDTEGLNSGAAVVLGTRLHQAAHTLAQARNINDTSRPRSPQPALRQAGRGDRPPARPTTGLVVAHGDNRQHRSVSHGARQPGPSPAHRPPPAGHRRRQHDTIQQPRGLRLRRWPTHPGVANQSRRRSDHLPGLR